MKIKVCECPKPACKYRWIPRVDSPKECPNCKHRFTADWGLKLKCVVHTVKSKRELVRLREEVKRWNLKGRWEAD